MLIRFLLFLFGELWNYSVSRETSHSNCRVYALNVIAYVWRRKSYQFIEFKRTESKQFDYYMRYCLCCAITNDSDEGQKVIYNYCHCAILFNDSATNGKCTMRLCWTVTKTTTKKKMFSFNEKQLSSSSCPSDANNGWNTTSENYASYIMGIQDDTQIKCNVKYSIAHCHFILTNNCDNLLLSISIQMPCDYTAQSLM